MTTTNHIAPPAGTARLGNAPLISVCVMAGVPELVRSAFGEQVFNKARQAAMLDFELIGDRNCFIPQRTMTSFVDAVARMTGEEHLGLQFAPGAEIGRYGLWGTYVLGADTLGAAVERAAATIGFHARGDTLGMDVKDGSARIRYASAARRLDGYQHVTWGNVGAILSLCRSYLPASWRPHRIDVDLPAPRRRAIFEDTFECPVVFDAPELAVWLSAGALPSAAHRATGMCLTVGDLARACGELHGLGGLEGVVAQQIWAQILTGSVSIESAARSLGTSVRTLQRELNREGADFRVMVSALRARRAVELLSETDASVTQISTTLGYSAPSHFARAFRKAVGTGPKEFRSIRCRGERLVPEPSMC